jgi:hypothetical protein
MAKKLTRTDSVDGGDLFVLYKTNQGDYRGASTATIQEWLQANTPGSSNGVSTTQYAQPNMNGFNITVTDGASDNTGVRLILTPVTNYTDGTITFPPASSAVDRQEILVTSTRQVANLTMGLNGASSQQGAPTSLAADGFFRMMYDAPTKVWYRVG